MILASSGVYALEVQWNVFMGMITYSFLGYDDKKNNMGIDYGQKEQCFSLKKKLKIGILLFYK